MRYPTGFGFLAAIGACWASRSEPVMNCLLQLIEKRFTYDQDRVRSICCGTQFTVRCSLDCGRSEHWKALLSLVCRFRLWKTTRVRCYPIMIASANLKEERMRTAKDVATYVRSTVYEYTLSHTRIVCGSPEKGLFLHIGIARRVATSVNPDIRTYSLHGSPLNQDRTYIGSSHKTKRRASVS